MVRVRLYWIVYAQYHHSPSLSFSLLAPTEIRSVSLIGVEHTCSVYDNYNINCVVTNNG